MFPSLIVTKTALTLRMTPGSRFTGAEALQGAAWTWGWNEKVVARSASTLMRKAGRLKLGILPLLKMQTQHASEDVKLAAENVM